MLSRHIHLGEMIPGGKYDSMGHSSLATREHLFEPDLTRIPLSIHSSSDEPSASINHNNSKSNYESIGSSRSVGESSKFDNARAISSDQFFDRDKQSDSSERYRLTKFQGSAAISSDDYFDREPQMPSGYSAVINNANLNDVKDYVRDGVKTAAERFSSYASNIMRRLNTDDF